MIVDCAQIVPVKVKYFQMVPNETKSKLKKWNRTNWLKENNEAIPLTSFHELELINAIHLKQFRTEITLDETRLIMSRFEEHEKSGVYYRPQLDWSAIFIHAIDLSKKHSTRTGSRSLDILHVASALSISADRFLTLDDGQTRLAALAGLKIENIKK